MSKKCRKCGGSGEMFVIEKDGKIETVPFSLVKTYEEQGWKDTGRGIDCSLCKGFGVEERP